MKYEIQAINETYNAIILERNGMYDYYLEKVGYGDLKHLLGLTEKVTVTEDDLPDEEEAFEFWGE